MTLIGMVGGATIAAPFSIWLETIVYGVSRPRPRDDAGVALLMCLVTGVAIYILARRASSVEPMRALREGEHGGPYLILHEALLSFDPRLNLSMNAITFSSGVR